MSVVWKFPLDVEDILTTVEMPKGAKVLSFGLQGARPMVWAEIAMPIEVDPSRAYEDRHFIVIPTGAPFSESLRRELVGAFISDVLVLHCFEVFP